MKCPREAVTLLDWLSGELVAAFADDSVRRTVVTLSRSDHRRLRMLLMWLRRSGLVGADAFSDLPIAAPVRRRTHGPYARGRCATCGREVAIRADGKTRFHRGSEACRYIAQDVAVRDPGATDVRK